VTKKKKGETKVLFPSPLHPNNMVTIFNNKEESFKGLEEQYQGPMGFEAFKAALDELAMREDAKVDIVLSNNIISFFDPQVNVVTMVVLINDFNNFVSGDIFTYDLPEPCDLHPGMHDDVVYSFIYFFANTHCYFFCKYTFLFLL
jgi:hypothetical protein